MEKSNNIAGEIVAAILYIVPVLLLFAGSAAAASWTWVPIERIEVDKKDVRSAD